MSAKIESGTIVIVGRHGRSRANEQKLIAGGWNVALVEQGEKEALELGEHLEPYQPITRVLSSDRRRAARTAFLATGKVPEQTLWLRERHFASLEGAPVTKEIVHFLYGRLHQDRYRDQIVPGAETDEQMEDRWGQFFKLYGSSLEGETSLLGTHGGMMVNLLHTIGYEDGARIAHVDNAAYVVFVAPGIPRLDNLKVVEARGIKVARR